MNRIWKCKSRSCSQLVHRSSFPSRPKKKLKAAFPTGVAKDWRNKVTAVGTTKKQGAKAAGDSIGGLADDDLDDLRPIGFGRNKSVCSGIFFVDAANPILDH